MTEATEPLTVAELGSCFQGVIPAFLATVSASGVPNVTYLSRVHPVDDERIALSNQFFSKSVRNLAEHPSATLMLVRPDTHELYRLSIVFEQTLRRGACFDRLRNDLTMIAALTGMQDVFRLRAADIFRVTDIEQIELNERAKREPVELCPPVQPDHAALGELCARLSRCSDLDSLVRVTVDGLAELLGHEHSMLLLADETGERLFTIASHGYPDQGVGSEVAVGEGLAGLAAERCEPMIAASMAQLSRYARRLRSSFEESGELGPGGHVPLPGLAEPGSQLAVPALSLGVLVGVVLVEHPATDRYGQVDLSALTVVASLLASTVETLRSEVRGAGTVPVTAPAPSAEPTRRPLHVRHFTADGSTFLDRDYLIKGVAGRILWTLLLQHEADGRIDFTNRELRLDASLDLPDFRDNLESRLILLKRRLDERVARVRIEKTGRGRFRLLVDADVNLERVDPT